MVAPLIVSVYDDLILLHALAVVCNSELAGRLVQEKPPREMRKLALLLNFHNVGLRHD